MSSEHKTAALRREDRVGMLIKNLDLNLIHARLIAPASKGGLGWKSKHAAFFIEEYRGFLFLVWKYPNKVFSPSREADEVWHTHILFTRKYAADSKKIFGRFLHHDPILHGKQ